MQKIKRRIRRGLKTKAIIKQHSSRPRLVVFRSAQHIYATIVVADNKGDRVLVSSSTVDSSLKSKLSGNKTEQAEEVGKILGERAKAKDIIEIAFDRSGYKYHGRVKALADAARKAGLIF